MHETEEKLSGLNLRTVCSQARCPNISECYNRGTATFLILGENCTRLCSFCNVKRGVPGPVDSSEPVNVANAVKKLGLKYAVVTSVTRDDLEDGGASHYAETIKQIRAINPQTAVEVLVPDFKCDEEAIKTVIKAGPACFAHNVETVPSLYHLRRGASYERSLKVIAAAKKINPLVITKSAIMLGLGERKEEVASVFNDLVSAGCDNMSIGQYIAPSKTHAEVIRDITDKEFLEYEQLAYKAGFKSVMSGRFVRSSYMAEKYKI